MLVFRALKTHKTHIHKNLFLAVLIQVLVRLIVYVDQIIIKSYPMLSGIDNTVSTYVNNTLFITECHSHVDKLALSASCSVIDVCVSVGWSVRVVLRAAGIRPNGHVHLVPGRGTLSQPARCHLRLRFQPQLLTLLSSGMG